MEQSFPVLLSSFMTNAIKSGSSIKCPFLESLKQKVELGYASALNDWGALQALGLGGQPDYAKAKVWFEKAIKQSDN